MTDLLTDPVVGDGQPEHGDVDIDSAERAVSALLTAMGIDHAEGTLAGTPRRVARSYAELLSPRPFQMTTFPNDEGYDEMVIVRDIPFSSVCEHHLLPFVGSAVVAYIPDERIVGLSKLARVVEQFARRLQVQERMTVQVAQFLQSSLDPKGVGVVLEASHTCMTVRGVGARGATTVTSSLLGLLRSDPRSRAEFLRLARPT